MRVRRAGVRSAWLAAVFSVLAGCASNEDEANSQNPSTADATAAADVNASGGASNDGASSGGTGTATGGTSGAGGAASMVGDGPLPYTLGRCPEGLPGPALVNVPGPASGTYCIDATEVTRGQYQEFVQAGYRKQADPVFRRCVDGVVEGAAYLTCNADVLGPSCEGNTYEPSQPDVGFESCTWWLSGMDDYPINCIDWCDAAGYCEWAGKRLCHSAGPIHSELVMACEGGWDGGQDFPASAWEEGTYAAPDRNDLSACNFNHGDAYDGLAPVGALRTCEGGYPGLFDLKGNVYELSSGSAETCCTALGGAFNSTEVLTPFPGPTTTCGSSRSLGPTLTRHDVGFRCCADALPEAP